LDAFEKNASAINLIYNRKGWEAPHTGMDFFGRSGPLGILNHVTPNLVFRDVRKYVEGVTKNVELIVHYTNQFSGILDLDNITDVVNIQDSPYYLEDSGIARRLYMKMLYNRIKHKSHIITNTNYLKNELIEFGFDGSITPIYLPYSRHFKRLETDRSELRKKLGLPDGKILVLSVSSTLPRKNLGMVERVMHSLGDRYRLVRIGEKIGNSITFNHIDYKEMNEIYNACDILLFPSLYEGFGLPIAEAFAAGLPVVTSHIPTIEEVCGGAAVLVDPKNLDEIVEGVKYAIVNSDHLKKVGLQRSSIFSFTNFKEKINKYYNTLTA
jgi:glycosyltransferase involved in cell wall biosynthesis